MLFDFIDLLALFEVYAGIISLSKICVVLTRSKYVDNNRYRKTTVDNQFPFEMDFLQLPPRTFRECYRFTKWIHPEI